MGQKFPYNDFDMTPQENIFDFPLSHHDLHTGFNTWGNNHSTQRLNELIDNAYALYQIENNEFWQHPTGFNSVQDVSDDIKVEYYRKQLFDFIYPIDTSLNFKLWDENGKEYEIQWKQHVETSIINYYYVHQIGDETPHLFKHHLKNIMRNIFPRYNDLYRSMLWDYEPLDNINFQEWYTKDNDDVTNQQAKSEMEENQTANQKTTNIAESASKQDDTEHTEGIGSDTPSSEINVSSFLNTHASNASKTDSEGTLSRTSNTKVDDNVDNVQDTKQDINQSQDTEYTGREKYWFHRKGNYGVVTTQQMIQLYRDLLIDIEMMIIKECKPLFNIYYGYMD